MRRAASTKRAGSLRPAVSAKPAAAETESMGPGTTRGPLEAIPVGLSLPEAGDQNAPAWEMVGAGRYMPRRIRGSCRGRELG